MPVQLKLSVPSIAGFLVLLTALLPWSTTYAQVVINEGSNRNYTTIHDEDGQYPDWIELYNSGSDTVQLYGYSLTDDPTNPSKWIFPNVTLAPGQYKIVFCSGKDRKPVTAFKQVLNTGTFKAVTGWNTHELTNPIYWDGTSNILLNICSYSNVGYTTNSVFNQTRKPYVTTLFAVQDGSPYICTTQYGYRSDVRPNIQFNGIAIDTGHIQNSPTDYPAPYGNWYWAAKHQMLFLASELTDAGLTAGPITSLAFDVVSTDPNTTYDYIDMYMKLVSRGELNSEFEPADTNSYLHTNFKIATQGETIYLYAPDQSPVSQLKIEADAPDNSNGLYPDGSDMVALFQNGTPAASNNASSTFSSYLLKPIFSEAPGFYPSTLYVTIANPNPDPSIIYYTLDGNDPTPESPVYTGEPIAIYYSSVLKARAFGDGLLPSPISVSSYLLGVSHVTPVLSVVTDRANLFGPTGIFDNWPYDWERSAYVEYFDSTRNLIFSQAAGMQIDGGLGGSRAQPQHSFRVELDHPVLGEGPIDYPLIPNRSERTRYSEFYLRNGSNQYLVLPYKDACQVEMMSGETNNYYSAWRPVTVYINGNYFGLYELREKINQEYFETLDGAKGNTVEILSQSFWYGGVLRAVEGSVDHFYDDYLAFNALDPAADDFWEQADRYIDMTWYNDYIIAESWMANTDWPGNNIKIYRSDKTDKRWRFCTIDMELALAPNSWTDCYTDHINYMLTQDPANPYINIWLKGIQNQKFRTYFINRFADVMNTTYRTERLLATEQSIFSQTVVEMPREYGRWGDANNIGQQMTDFTNRHHEFRFQLSQRTEQVRNHIQSNFGLNGQVAVTLETDPPGSGRIQISTIIPDALPWTGIYFDGNPVVIKAIPNPGYRFAYWEPNAILSEQNPERELALNINTDVTFHAVFVPQENPASITISELNYHPDSTRNSGDWLELYNFGAQTIDLSSWVFTDGQADKEFTFANETMIQPGQRLVIAEDPTKFQQQHPGVPSTGPLDFEFSNATETLSLYDASGLPVLSMTYEDSAPWPKAADGNGRTLELLSNTDDLNLPGSWFAGCIGGSPGEAYSPCTENIIITEINYKSADAADAGDWIEIYNRGNTTTNLTGWVFSDSDNTHVFPIPSGTMLPPAGYLVLFGDAVKFDSRFPGVTNRTGPFNFGLSSTGEALRLFDASGKLYQSVVYDTAAPWPQGAAGNGYTLELADREGKYCDGGTWTIGCPEGSPGGPYTTPCATTGIASLSDEVETKIFPNPTTGIITIYVKQGEQEDLLIGVDIFNMLGIKVYAHSNPSEQTPLDIDLSHLSDGLYIAKINVGGKFRSERIMLSHQMD